MNLVKKPISFLSEQPVHLLEKILSRRNAILVLNLLGMMIILIFIYAVIFIFLARWEGHDYGFVTAIYWIFTTMTTLGLGDIYFESLPGQIFTVIVLVNGVFFILVMVPFLIFQLFQSARVRRELPKSYNNHIIITHLDNISETLITKLKNYNYRYILIVENIKDAMEMIDIGYEVILGNVKDQQTLHHANIEKALLVTATGSDAFNTQLVYNVKHISGKISVASTATNQTSAKVLALAGSNLIVGLDEMIGRSLARRTTAGDAMAHIIGNIDELYIAEATVKGTPLVDKKLSETNIREITGTTIVGIWERGQFKIARADSYISSKSILVLVGSIEQIESYNAIFCIYNQVSEPVIIVGETNIAKAAIKSLEARNVAIKIISEKKNENSEKIVVGDPADEETLTRAGIEKSPAILITTKNDAQNIFLTTLCRNLNPGIQIISFASNEESAHLLNEAGCDSTVSSASVGANSIFNFIKSGDILMVSEGVDIFRISTPKKLLGKAIFETDIVHQTGCNIIGIKNGSDMRINPKPDTILQDSTILYLIGTVEAEATFVKIYSN